MIPIKLVLRNFMSYGAEPVIVPFEGLHVACLSGDNGNGKSAILDAITWALWDKTRASSKDDVIRLGADDVEVSFEFQLNDHRYRVVKKRKRGKVSTSDWQLTQIDSSGQHTPVGGGSQKETARQIVQLLSMEYETFLNSAYLQQGHADEFTRQTPDKRKQILGEILGLDRYTRLEEKARARQKDCKLREEELAMQIRLLDSEIGNLPQWEQSLADTGERLTELALSLKQQEQIATELREERSRLKGIAAQVEQAQQIVTQLERDRQLRETERCRQRERIQQIDRIVVQKEAILADYQRLQFVRKRREELDPQMDAYSKANADLRSTQGTIDIAEKELRGQISLADSHVQRAEERVQERDRLENQLKKIRIELGNGESLERERNATLLETQRLQEEFNILSARNKELSGNISEIEEVLTLLDRPHATCPVCESDLRGARHEAVVQRQQEKKTQLLAAQKQIRQEGATRKQELGRAQTLLDDLTKRCTEHASNTRLMTDITNRLREFADAGEKLKVAQKELQIKRTQLEKGEFAMAQRITRQRLQKELEQLGLLKSEYDTVKASITRLEGAQKRYQDLERAEASLPEAMEEIGKLDRLIADIERRLVEEKAKRDGLKAQLEQFDQVRNRAAVAESKLAELQKEVQDLKAAEASYRNFIERAGRAVAEKKEREKEKAKAEDDKRLYTGLMNAFGRKGVQSLIIENAIPELEEEANGLLARITDNALHVRFRTTKITKVAKEEVETLDIEVSDDAGTRAYEMFSGGEAFRINFAVRIALSRLLARRSGARLQTLIMDEGFGSQDGKGREKLIEAIDSIKDDFEKILVITHVDELKDAFSQRIEVTKDARGSHVHLL